MGLFEWHEPLCLSMHDGEKQAEKEISLTKYIAGTEQS